MLSNNEWFVDQGKKGVRASMVGIDRHVMRASSSNKLLKTTYSSRNPVRGVQGGWTEKSRVSIFCLI